MNVIDAGPALERLATCSTTVRLWLLHNDLQLNADKSWIVILGTGPQLRPAANPRSRGRRQQAASCAEAEVTRRNDRLAPAIRLSRLYSTAAGWGNGGPAGPAGPAGSGVKVTPSAGSGDTLTGSSWARGACRGPARVEQISVVSIWHHSDHTQNTRGFITPHIARCQAEPQNLTAQSTSACLVRHAAI